MSSILVLAETRRGELRDITGELVGAALALKAETGLPVEVAIVAADPESFAAAVPGEVDRILAIEAPTEHFEPHVQQRALEALIAERGPRVVLAGQTIDTLGFVAAVAARLETGFAADVTSIEWDDGPVATRGEYGDKLVAELDFPAHRCVLLTLRPGTFAAPPAAAGAQATPVELDLAGAAASEHRGFEDVPETGVDITRAPLLLSIGRGMDDEEEIPRFEALAERLGGLLSASRPLIDSGWVGSDRQVGQSGKTVKPRLYLALGISGAVQHLAGMRDAETVIAVNNDSEAPIFGIADFGAVADLFDVVDALEQELG